MSLIRNKAVCDNLSRAQQCRLRVTQCTVTRASYITLYLYTRVGNLSRQALSRLRLQLDSDNTLESLLTLPQP
jgi:hypothetical protein